MPQNQTFFRKRTTLWGIGISAVALAAGAYFFVAGTPDRRPAGPFEKVTLVCTTITDTALVVVAERQGYTREEGLEVTVRRHPYGKLALQDLLEGKADFATVAETPVMFAILKGQKIAVIATIQSTNRVNSIVARRDRGINAVADLRGRKIAVTLGTTLDYFLDAVLAGQGISRKEVSLIDMRAEEIPAALARGDVDAASMFQPYRSFAQKALGERGITFQSSDIYTSFFNVVAPQYLVVQNPGKVVKLLRALVKAEAFVSRHPAEAQKIVADFSGLDAALVRDGWDDNHFGVTLDQSLLLELEDETRWAIRNRLTGGVKKIPNYLDFIYLEGLASLKPKAVNILK